MGKNDTKTAPETAPSVAPAVPQTIQMFATTVDTFNKVFAYLETRPHREVDALLDEIRKNTQVINVQVRDKQEQITESN